MIIMMIMMIRPSKSKYEIYKIKLQGEDIEKTESEILLGLPIQNELDWKKV